MQQNSEHEGDQLTCQWEGNPTNFNFLQHLQLAFYVATTTA